jgi:hypothetical protein
MQGEYGEFVAGGLIYAGRAPLVFQETRPSFELGRCAKLENRRARVQDPLTRSISIVPRIWNDRSRRNVLERYQWSSASFIVQSSVNYTSPLQPSPLSIISPTLAFTGLAQPAGADTKKRPARPSPRTLAGTLANN